MNKLTGEIDVSSINYCYVKAILKIPCPDCGNKMEHDFSENYIMYPGDDGHDIDLQCHICSDNENEVIFNLPMKFVSAKIELAYDLSNLVTEKENICALEQKQEDAERH